MPAATASENARFVAATAALHGVNTSTRAASHSATIATSAGPVGVGRWVQLRTIAKRKPAATANV